MISGTAPLNIKETYWTVSWRTCARGSALLWLMPGPKGHDGI